MSSFVQKFLNYEKTKETCKNRAQSIKKELRVAEERKSSASLHCTLKDVDEDEDGFNKMEISEDATTSATASRRNSRDLCRVVPVS